MTNLKIQVLVNLIKLQSFIRKIFLILKWRRDFVPRFSEPPAVLHQTKRSSMEDLVDQYQIHAGYPESPLKV